MNNFNFNRKNSFYDMKLGIVGSVTLPIIKETTEIIEVENRSTGSLTIKTGHYKDVEISLKLKLLDTTNYKDKIRQLNEYFEEIKDNRLWFYDYPQKCYRVKYVEFENIEKAHRKYGLFTINFICEPFMYLSKENSVIISNGDKIANIGDLEGEPILKLTLPNNKQNISIMFNGEEIQFREVSDYLEVNTPLLVAVDDTKHSVTSKMIGEFPKLIKGENTISWTGIINKFELIKNTRFKG